MREKKVTKEKIIKMAVRLMAEKGYNAVSMNEIATNLGITKPMLYYHFKNKDEIIKEAFYNKAKEIKEMKIEIDDNTDIEDIIYQKAISHYNLIKKNPNVLKCFFKIIDSPKSNPLHRYAIELRENNIKKIKDILERLSEKNKIKKENIEYAIYLISSLISYIMFEMRIKPDNINEKIINNLSKIMAIGIKNLKAIILLFIFSLSSFSQVLKLTLNDAIDIALKNNTSIINAIEMQKSYEEKIKEYYGGTYPQISFQASYTKNIEKQAIFFGGGKSEVGLDNAYSASLDLNQILWSGGKVDSGIKMARIYSNTAKENRELTENTIKKSIKQLYYSINLFKELREVQRETLDISKQYLDTMKEKFKQGLVSDLVVMRQEIEVSNNESNLIKAENIYEQGLLQLKNLLGIDPTTDIEIIENLQCSFDDDYDFELLYNTALNNRQDYKLALLNKEMAEQQVKLEKAEHWPTLSGFISRGFIGQTNSSSFPNSSQSAWTLTAGVRLSVPIFSGFSVVSRTKQAEYNLKIAENNLNEMKRKIKIELIEILLNLKEAKKRLDTQKTSLDTAKKTADVTYDRFKNGLASQLELNDSNLALNRAKTLYFQAKYDLCYYKAQIDWALGR